MKKHNPTQPQTQKTLDLVHDVIHVRAWDLHSTQGTLQGIATAFDDINTALHLITHGNLLPDQITAIARLAQSHANDWAEIAEIEQQKINNLLNGGEHEYLS